MDSAARVMLLQITSSYFCAGVLLSDGIVVTSAPILSYMIDWPEGRVIKYCRRKGWKCIDSTSYSSAAAIELRLDGDKAEDGR